MRLRFVVSIVLATALLVDGRCHARERPPDTTAGARDYSLGHCRVALDAREPCVAFRGKTASGIAPGCMHDDCTAAKYNARQNLLTGIPPACGAYIDCGGPCECIQKRAAPAPTSALTPRKKGNETNDHV